MMRLIYQNGEQMSGEYIVQSQSPTCGVDPENTDGKMFGARCSLVHHAKCSKIVTF